MVTSIKKYPGFSEECCYEIALNKICSSFEFKSFVSGKCLKCPANLTIECYLAKEGLPGNPKYIFPIVIKEYGYDSLCNQGQAYSDMGDYRLGDEVKESIKEAVKEYFKANEPILYKEMEYGFR